MSLTEEFLCKARNRSAISPNLSVFVVRYGRKTVLKRRVRTKNSKTRDAIIKAAHRLMVEEGYGAVTSRRLNEKAGLKSQLVHYHFRTMDDLFLAVFRRAQAEYLERQAQALSSNRPLEALWEFSVASIGTPFAAEFLALANHRKMIRKEVAHASKLARRIQAKTLSRILKDHGIQQDACSPISLAIIIMGISRVLVADATLGISEGRTQTIKLIKRYIRNLESGQASE